MIVLRSGNAGSNTAADHIEVISRALGRADLGPGQAERSWCAPGEAGGAKETVEFLTRRRVSYGVGFKLPDRMPRIYDTIPEAAWIPAYDADGEPGDGVDIAKNR